MNRRSAQGKLSIFGVQALHVLDMLKSTGARPDTIMYTNLITGARCRPDGAPWYRLLAHYEMYITLAMLVSAGLCYADGLLLQDIQTRCPALLQ